MDICFCIYICKSCPFSKCAGFLIENATERYIHFKKLYPNLSERVSQRHIATYLGITPESLSRIRGAMKED